MKMKIVLAAMICMIGLIAAGCDLFKTPVSVKSRLDSFVAALNSDRGSIYKNFDLTTAAYINGSSTTYWDVTFPAGSYSISNINDSNTSGVTANLSGPVQYLLNPNVQFEMVKDIKGDYYIKKVLVSNVQVTFNEQAPR